MPPKQQSKADLAKKQKIVEDKTFGLKNKNKSKNVQKYVQSLKQNVQPKPDATAINAKKKKEEEKAREKELNDLFKIAVSQPKVPVGVDPKSILCEHFKVGQCAKGFKCKFSHDLNVQRKGEKIDIYSDKRDQEQEEQTMEDWDQETLEKVVQSKSGEYNKNKPTDIVCKYFLEAVEKKQYGWFWACPNGGKDCHYRHALPPGYVLKSQMKALLEEESEKISVEEEIENQRAKVITTTPMTTELFMEWKKKKMEERDAGLAAQRAERARKFAPTRQMAKQLCEVHWTESALSNLDIQITPAFVDEALKSYWEVFAAGKAGHVKAYLTFNKNVPGWTEGALIGYFGRYSGTKDIHFAPTNAATGKPLQHSDIFLRDKVSGTLLMSVEGVAISNGRTGWFSLACVNLLLQGREDIDVFLFGAGKVAEAVILSLNYGAAKRIRKVAVLSRGKKSNFELVEKLRDCVTFSLEAVGDRSLLPYSQFVIMATNYGKPVFEAAEIAPNAVTLSLGIDDMPPDYIEHVLSADGLIVADDLVAMEARNVDAVALYYSRRGMKLTQHGKRDGIKNYTEILDDEALMNDLKAWKGPANFSPVGLASIDVAVAAHVYETLLNKLAGPMEHGH